MKAWFLARVAREKVLMVVFVLAAAIIWISSAGERLTGTTRELRTVGAELDAQQVWLDNRQTIEGAAALAVQNLDPSRTYDSTALVAEVMALASQAGLAVNTDPPRTQRTSQFAFHTLQVSSRRADFGAVIRFYTALAERSPYLGLEQMTLQADGGSGALNVRMQIASVELVK
ncbi:MAG: hypothetical protein ABII82_06450 [Verrucomicrobiota bacterium]